MMKCTSINECAGGGGFNVVLAYKHRTKPYIRTIRDTVMLVYDNNLINITWQYYGDTEPGNGMTFSQSG